jgi:hypothetical protein
MNTIAQKISEFFGSRTDNSNEQTAYTPHVFDDTTAIARETRPQKLTKENVEKLLQELCDSDDSPLEVFHFE